jgi:hypothetical protein
MLRLLHRHRLLLAVLVTSTLIGAVCAKVNTSGNLQEAAASTHLFIDDPDASIVDRSAVTGDFNTLQKRAVLYGRLMATPSVLDAIGKRAGLPPEQISGITRITEGEPHSLLQIGSEERANQIRESTAPYRLEMQASPVEPILTIYSAAPSLLEARRLADSAILGLTDYLRKVAQQQGFPERELPQLRQLGSARGGVTNSGARIEIGGLTFITAFALSFVGLFVLAHRPWRRREEDVTPPPPRSRLTERAAADWPRTTRLLPWSIAGLIAMFWLTPFDRIQLAMSAPINITLDRIVLPVVAAIWLIALTAGPGARPRLRITRVHVALGLFLACALLSVVLDARYLNHTGDLTLSVKKLPLLFSYISIFVIVASSVRRTEVPAFMSYTLVLAVVCGLEVVYESHFKQNLFNVWSQMLLPHPFELADSGNGLTLDSLGRSWVQGPAGYGVELVAMLSMVLPIPVLGILNSKTRKRQIVYSLAIVVLVTAMFMTQRKSALLIPGAVILSLAYFRGREIISLVPLGLVLVVVVAALSPGVIHGVISQYTNPSSTRTATVSDRTADYDAVRPDVWTHLAFGRGYGSYDPHTYRVLDSEILGQTVETGVLGLATFLLIGVSLILVVRKTASQRDPRWSPAALCGVAAGVCLFIASILYDFLGFPHGAVTFLYIAGLVVAVVAPGAEPVKHPRAARDHGFRTHAQRHRFARAATERGVRAG